MLTYKHKATNKNATFRPLKSCLINNPCVALLWTDPPAVAPCLHFGRHCLLKKGKAWSRSETIIRGGCGTWHAEVIPRNPALRIWGTQFHLLRHAWLPISKNMNINCRWQRAKIGGYQNPGTGKDRGWGILFLEWKPWVQTPQGEETVHSTHLHRG